jgi:hypothetical protein
MADHDDSLGALVGRMSPAQLWSVAVALVAVLGGAFGLGVFVQNTRNDRVLLEKERESGEVEAELQTHKAQLKAAQDALTLESDLIAQLNAKARFLAQYVTYLRQPGETSKKVFVDLVCGMWREDQRRRIRLERAPLQLTAADLLRGASPDVQRVLEESGVPLQLVVDIRRLERTRVTRSPRVTKESAEAGRLQNELQSSLANVALAKIVTFSETESYVLPDEVAASVHLRTDCKP